MATHEDVVGCDGSGAGFRFDPKHNRFSFHFSGFDLNDCSAFLETREMGGQSPIRHDLRWRAAERTADTVVLEAENALGQWRMVLSLTEDVGVSGVKILLSGNLTRALRALRLVPLFAEPFQADHVLVHGRKMGGCDALPLPAAEPASWTSSFQQMITCGGVTLQLSHPLRQGFPSTIAGTVHGGEVRELSVDSLAEFLQPGAVAAEAVTLRADRNGHDLMTSWGDREKTPGTTLATQTHGWNSWDFYRWTITEEETLVNAEFIRNDPVLSRHVRRIIVDDGWQYAYGEWDANPLFPSGMEKLARTLTRMGFEPGLWFAPCVIEPHCRIAQWDDDMLALGESGYPCLCYSCMQRNGFVLDPTVPKTRTWLYNLFDRYAAMGYRYFKLDFLYQVLKAPRFHDTSVPKGRMMDLLVGPIREATRGRAQILGCNYNFEGGSTLVDAVRVSGDIHPKWSSTKANVFPIAARFWSHNRLWINDPDFAVCRGRETSDDPDLNRMRPCLVFIGENTTDPETLRTSASGLCDLSLVEARTLMGLVVISGGAINLSDKLPLLNEAGLDLMRRAVAAPIGGAGVPLDLFSARRPCTWLQPVGRGMRAMLINWEDQPGEMEIDLGRRRISANRAVDFWTDRLVPIRNGILRAELAPHESLLVDLHAAG